MPPNSSVARRDESLRNRACLVCECGVSTQRKNEDEKEKSEKPREVKVSFDFVLAIFPRFSFRSTRRVSSVERRTGEGGIAWNLVSSGGGGGGRQNRRFIDRVEFSRHLPATRGQQRGKLVVDWKSASERGSTHGANLLLKITPPRKIGLVSI